MEFLLGKISNSIYIYICISQKVLLVYSLTWLKKKLKTMGLHRKGPSVQYSPISQMQAAVEV